MSLDKLIDEVINCANSYQMTLNYEEEALFKEFITQLDRGEAELALYKARQSLMEKNFEERRRELEEEYQNAVKELTT